MPFTLEHEEFSGPLALLLEFIHEQKLAITQVSLAKVADDFLEYIEKHQVPSHELADFLVIASRLIYLKSRELMPYLRLEEEDVGVTHLEDQLRLYQEFVAAAATLEERYAERVMYCRPYDRRRESRTAFSPANNVSLPALHESFQSVLKRLEPFFSLQEASLARTKSVEECMHELQAALEGRARMRFRDVVASAGSTVEIVVSFLALLELLRRKCILATQEAHGEEIHLERL